MKTTKIKTMAALILVVAVTLSSCRREKDDFETVCANNQAMADETFNDVDNIADEGAVSGTVSYKNENENNSLAGCATVTRDTVSLPHITTVDFGVGCTGVDGRTRTGQIIVSYDGPYRAAGTTITITFNNYFVNGNQVLGTKTIHNDGVNGNGNLSFSISVNGQIILANNEGTITWTSARFREWISGESTPSRDDDQYSVTGTADGTAANGDQFSAATIEPLIRNLAPTCRRHFVAGMVELNRTGKPTRTVDFGSGACDDEATVTINGVTRTIHLRP